MNETEKISPDDPRLTAYALGELEQAEREEFERQLQSDSDARATVEEIRATAAALGTALEDEAAASAPSIDAIPLRAETGATAERPRRREATLLTFPRFYYVAAGLAAACFAVVYVADNLRNGAELAQTKSVVRHQLPEDAVAAAAPAPAAFDADGAIRAPTARARTSGEPPMFALVPAEMQVADRFFASAEATTSTFPLRLDRAAFAAVREALRRGERPAKDRVHVAELINAFEYTWPAALPGEAFSTLLEETAAPWASEHRLVRVGLKGVGSGEIARAAQVQVEFNPAVVRAWRLIGFERNAAALGVSGDAHGETMRGGDTVTALYEIVPAAVPAEAFFEQRLLSVALQYVDAATGSPRTIARQLHASGAGFARASEDMKFVAGVAAFGLALRGSSQQPASSLEDMTQWAEAGAGADPQKREFVTLMQRSGGWLQ